MLFRSPEGSSTVSVEIDPVADALNEPRESVLVQLRQGHGYVTGASPLAIGMIEAPVTYAIGSNRTGVNDGGAVTFTVTTTGVAAGTRLGYRLDGATITPQDLVGEQLTGVATVGVDGKACFTVRLAADQFTEGAETLMVTVMDQSVSVVVADTSSNPGSAAALGGLAYLWKGAANGHPLLDGVSVSAAGGPPVAEGTDASLWLRNISLDGGGRGEAEVWARLTSDAEALDFSLSVVGATDIRFAASLPDNWTTVDNPGGGTYAFAAFATLPGLALQKITTKEPDQPQLETAIRALEEALTV